MLWAFVEVGLLTVVWLIVIVLLFARHIFGSPD
jgi:hypothetical protein